MLDAIYKAATAAKIAPIAPMNEPVRTLAALVETVAGLVEVPEADLVVEVLMLVPTGTVLLPPLTPVGEDVEPVVVADEPIPLPAPSDGVSPEPEEATCPPVAAVERDEAALFTDVTEPLPPTAVELEDGATVDD
jgi:hypothetical protein